jgi:hypothetical protein
MALSPKTSKRCGLGENFRLVKPNAARSRVGIPAWLKTEDRLSRRPENGSSHSAETFCQLLQVTVYRACRTSDQAPWRFAIGQQVRVFTSRFETRIGSDILKTPAGMVAGQKVINRHRSGVRNVLRADWGVFPCIPLIRFPECDPWIGLQPGDSQGFVTPFEASSSGDLSG